MPFFKTVVLGCEKSGKSSIIRAILEDKHVIVSPYTATLEDVYIKNCTETNAKGKPISIHFWDTSGAVCNDMRERNRYYEFADAVILVYNPGNPESLKKIQDIKKELDDRTKRLYIMIVENQINDELHCRQKSIDSDDKSENPCSFHNCKTYRLLPKDNREDLKSLLRDLTHYLAGTSHTSSIKRATSKTSVNSTVKNAMKLIPSSS